MSYDWHLQNDVEWIEESEEEHESCHPGSMSGWEGKLVHRYAQHVVSVVSRPTSPENNLVGSQRSKRCFVFFHFMTLALLFNIQNLKHKKS